MPKVLSVSQFVEHLNQSLKTFREFKVEGEVTDFSITHNKWVGFDLKDEEEKQVLSCFTSYSLFKKRMNLKGVLEEGMRVQVKGDIKIRQRGDLSMFCKQIELTGGGTLKKAYEKLKKKLKKEGLFREERKRALPEFPRRIGLITSSEARAFSDFIKGLRERRGGLKIYHAGVHVQGKNAVPEILGAFQYFKDHQDEFNLDGLVLVRGGGSLEDLQAFNSEKVARAVFSAPVPVVCGVGHQDDVTLAGLTADLRASTPSNSAELLVHTSKEILKGLKNSVYKMKVELEQILEENRDNLHRFNRSAAGFVRARRKSLKNIFEKFQREILIFEKRVKTEKKKTRRFYSIGSGFLEREKEKLIQAQERLLKLIRKLYLETKRSFIHKKSLLKSYSPQSALERGYSIVRNKGGKIVKSVQDLNPDDKLKVRLNKGEILALVEKIFNS